jgi:putative transposase
MQAALEASVTELVGRPRPARPAGPPGLPQRHGELHVSTTAGPVVLERPRLRATTEPFASRRLGKGVSHTNAPESLVLSGFVPGLRVWDVEAAADGH